MDKKEHIGQIYEHLKNTGRIHTRRDLAEAINASEATISNALRGIDKYLTDNLFGRIALQYSDVFNKEWVISGKGEMLRPQTMNNVSGTVVGNNNSGGVGDINIHSEKNIAAVINSYEKQLAKKDEQITELHSIIDKLISR